jgi:hypothetical protein
MADEDAVDGLGMRRAVLHPRDVRAITKGAGRYQLSFSTGAAPRDSVKGSPAFRPAVSIGAWHSALQRLQEPRLERH